MSEAFRAAQDAARQGNTQDVVDITNVKVTENLEKLGKVVQLGNRLLQEDYEDPVLLIATWRAACYWSFRLGTPREMMTSSRQWPIFNLVMSYDARVMSVLENIGHAELRQLLHRCYAHHPEVDEQAFEELVIRSLGKRADSISNEYIQRDRASDNGSSGPGSNASGTRYGFGKRDNGDNFSDILTLSIIFTMGTLSGSA